MISILPNIGNISRVPIRDEFKNEEYDFTPWLKNNLHYIGEKLQLSFTDETDIEVPVGKYSCDVLAHTSNGKTVVIENQFGHADHDHLGKILTYAAGLEADIIIWIAEDFFPEHVTALNWLNSISTENTPSFFAIKIGLIQIGDSKPALDIETIVIPDQWARQVKSARITASKGLRHSPEIDTIVCPCKSEGFNNLFLKEHKWFAITINSIRIPKIKYIAMYESSPVSAINYIGEVEEIRPYKDSGKYEVVLKRPATKLKTPIKLSNEYPYLFPQGPQYTIRRKFEGATKLEDIFPQ